MFFRNYTNTTHAFLDACEEKRIDLERYPHPTSSALATHVARVGNPVAEKKLVVISGTHGVEGFLGSACQTEWIRTFDYATLPPDCAIYLIHALNPWGMAHLRRVDHENIDVNRNFLDDWSALPKNEGHLAYSMEIFMDSLHGTDRPITDEAIAAIMRGQYTHANGIFYGGTAPSWSHTLLRSIVQKYLAKTQHVAVVDFHTGLGKPNAEELICPWPTSDAPFNRARQWYSGYTVQSPVAGCSISGMVFGDLLTGIARMLPGRAVTAGAAEFGTDCNAGDMVKMLIWENFAHHTKHLGGPREEEIKKGLLDHFAPSSLAWQKTSTAKGVDIINRAIAGLAAS